MIHLDISVSRCFWKTKDLFNGISLVFFLIFVRFASEVFLWIPPNFEASVPWFILKPSPTTLCETVETWKRSSLPMSRWVSWSKPQERIGYLGTQHQGNLGIWWGWVHQDLLIGGRNPKQPTTLRCIKPLATQIFFICIPKIGEMIEFD